MRLLKHKLFRIAVFTALLLAVPLSSMPAYAAKTCGSGPDAVHTTIDFGCQGSGCGQTACNPIYDMTYAVVRFLADGVGLIIAGSLVVAGIQYSASRGDPKASESAQARIQSTVVALLIYIFAYALLNYLIPGGMAHP